MIFINYRIDDSLDMVARLHADLTREFGAENVFRDKTGIQPGEDWPQKLRDEVKSRRVTLIIIGPRWQEVETQSGPRKGLLRISDPDDWVRKEILTALDCVARDRSRTVIPVLLHEVRMPEESWLQTYGLAGLYSKQAAKLRTDPEYQHDLAALVELLRKVCPELPAPTTGERPAADGRLTWPIAAPYPLQPAPNFSGRERLLAELAEWGTSPAPAIRVTALVSPGGTGKTALAERILAALPDDSPFGVFVWSFYENYQTEAFLRAACQYVLRIKPEDDNFPPGGLLERLQRSLNGNVHHVFILDGLERVQSEGSTGRPRGELEDPLLKRLLRWLAAGKGTRAKALVTSRFPLTDLADWRGGGFREILLDDLDVPAARAVFRKWEVKGDDRTLDVLAEQVHRHALTVDVLGSYLATFHAGDPAQAPSFAPQQLVESDPKTAKLHRVLTSYAEKLQAKERDLLSRLSVFPRGVDVELMGCLVDAGGKVAGALIGCTLLELKMLLERLRRLGLVFRYDTAGVVTFTAHPFVRGFFEKLLGVDDPKLVYETVRSSLSASLEARPSGLMGPTDPATLDIYERLIEVTRLAGRTKEAYELYRRMGSYRNVGHKIGDYSRGLRILSSFSPDGTPEAAILNVSDRERGEFMTDWSLYAQNLGDLTIARRGFAIVEKLDKADFTLLASTRRNVAHVEYQTGRWAVALNTAESALEMAAKAKKYRLQLQVYAYIAFSQFRQGNIAAARRNFVDATFESVEETRRGVTVYSEPSIFEVELRLAIGDGTSALSQAKQIRAQCAYQQRPRDIALCDTLLGHCALPGDLAEARQHLAAAREFASRTGDIEVTLRSYQLAATIERHERNFTAAIAEAESGIQLADSCGFGRWSIDIRLELSRIILASGNWQAAIAPAEDALARSEHPDCQDAWGIADALYQLGAAHARLGETPKARDFLKQALKKRRAIKHAGLQETEIEIKNLKAG